MQSDSEIDLLKYLSETTLQRLDRSGEKFQASELWKDNGVVLMVVRRVGCSLCREEAQDLSGILPKLQEKGFSLIAVVQESLGVAEFQSFFEGQIYLDPDRRFYGPKERKIFWNDLFKPSTWRALYAIQTNGIPGNYLGEWRVLGGLFVIGPKNAGILLEHREDQLGFRVKTQDIIAAIEASCKDL